MIATSTKQLVKKVINAGTSCYCPVCKTSIRQFQPTGKVNSNLRPNAKCPICHSLERHRMIWLYLEQETNLLVNNAKKMLHVAPEKCLEIKFSQLSHLDYLTADLINPAMVQMDLTNIQYPDNSFDIIYCSHVLEHIPDDRKAMKELARVLSPDGWAILQVPIDRDTTFEDPSITDPFERERLFGQKDHVRAYGRDYQMRLEQSGFRVKVIPFLDKFDYLDKQRLGLNIVRDDIFLCTSDTARVN